MTYCIAHHCPDNGVPFITPLLFLGGVAEGRGGYRITGIKNKPDYFSAVFGGFSAVLLIDNQQDRQTTEVQNSGDGGKLHFFRNHMTHNQSVTRASLVKKRFSAEITKKR